MALSPVQHARYELFNLQDTLLLLEQSLSSVGVPSDQAHEIGQQAKALRDRIMEARVLTQRAVNHQEGWRINA